MKETSHSAYHESSRRKCISQQAELPQVQYYKGPLLLLNPLLKSFGGRHNLSSTVAFSLPCSTVAPSLLPLAADEFLRPLLCSWWPNRCSLLSAFSHKESGLKQESSLPHHFLFHLIPTPNNHCTSRIPAAGRQTNRLCLQMVSGIKIILSELWYKMLNRACIIIFG